MGDSLRIVVLGMMGRCPYGGQTWLYLNWLRGLKQLGHDIWYVEDDSVWPYDPVQNTATDDCSYAVKHLQLACGEIGLMDRWVFRLADRKGACWGLSESELADLYRSTDILLNIVGAVDLREEHMCIPVRVYVECDPVTAELRLANGDEHTRAAFDRHTHLVTYGENYGAADCGVPLNGRTYGKTRQPIDLDLWPYAFDPKAKYFTTIGNYRQSGSDVVFNGETYRWSKHHEWEKFIGLPARTAQPFEIAVMPDNPKDRAFLDSHGWNLIPPFEMSLDIFGAYPEYFRRSRGEFTVAKDQNVRLRSGWFSERDVCYLATGKPVVAQDTGFSAILPTGEGLFGVHTLDEAAAAVEAINSDYERHCRAARALAEEYFEARKIAHKLLADVGGCVMVAQKHVIFNADDFGASMGVNRGIVECHRHGVLTSTSFMVTGRAAEEAVAMSRDNPELSVGLHWDAWGEDEREFSMSNRAAVREEFHRQLDGFHRYFGRLPSHVDSHRHAHHEAFELFREMAAPLGVPLRQDGRVKFIGGFYAQWEWMVTNLHYVSVGALEKILRTEIAPGFTEVSCHPGYVSPDYKAVYLTEREEELRTLLSPHIKDVLREEGIQLVSYAEYNHLSAR